MIKRPELLAPVGKLESFYAAIENGANAVYVGGTQFSARQFADNLDIEQLKEITQYSKLRNIKVYITLNTLIKNGEIDSLISYIHQLSEINVDALIIQDFGVAYILKQYFPNISFHASTQMSAHSKYDVEFLKDKGYKRVVLARELSLDEIKAIKEEVTIEIETFVHGALCVSYSGQCLMSSLIGGRSGNRGRCAQPCRLPYILTKDGVIITSKQEPYLMSPKDIQTLDLLPSLINLGVDTFKIEGRMKTPQYVAGVTNIYNKYIKLALEEKQYKVNKEDEDELLTLFNRGGFTNGYYTCKGGKQMIETKSPKNIGLEIGKVLSYYRNGEVKIKTNKSLNPGDGIGIWTKDNAHVGAGINEKIQAGSTFVLRIKGNISEGDVVYLSKDHQLLGRITKSYNKNNKKSNIMGTSTAKLGMPIQLDLTHENGMKISVIGDVVCAAKNAPMSDIKIKNQISKFGNTPFLVTNMDLNMDANIYVSVASLNQLRRDGAQALMDKIIYNDSYDGGGYARYKENPLQNNYKVMEDKTLSVVVRTLGQLKACLGVAQDIYWELENQNIQEIQEAINLCHYNNARLYMALPYIQRKQDYEIYDDLIKELEISMIDGYLIRTYGQYEKLKTSSKRKIIDYTLNVMNNYSIAHWEAHEVDTITLSLELSADEIQNIKGKCLEMVVYGHIPIMTSEQCLVGRYDNCNKNLGSQDSVYNLLDRKEELYPVMTNCKLCRMQILSSKPIGLWDKMKHIKSLPIHKIRLIFTNEDTKTIKEILSCYLDELPLCDKEYTRGYFIKGVE